MRDRAEDDRSSSAADDVLSGRRSLYNLFAHDRSTEAARDPSEQGMTEGRQSMLEEDGLPPAPRAS